MHTDSPFEGDGPDDGEEPCYEWLDEWLCEYVDGTMDPSLEAVFEKYVEANPELKAHVERLQETRELLCNCGLPRNTAPEVKADVCREAECEGPEGPPPEKESAPEHPIAAVGLVSSVTAALIVGFLVGAMVVGPLPSDEREAGTAPRPVATDAEPVSAEPVLPVRRSATSVVPTDSVHAPSTFTPIGMP